MMSDVPNPYEEPLQELTEANQPWWRRYSRHGEFPWSTVMSFAMHLFILLVIAVAAVPLLNYDRTPPAVDVVYVADDAPAPGSAADLPGGSLEEGAAETPDEAVPDEMPETQIDQLPEPQQIDREKYGYRQKIQFQKLCTGHRSTFF